VSKTITGACAPVERQVTAGTGRPDHPSATMKGEAFMTEETKGSRRNFLKLATVSAPAAAVALATGTQAEAGPAAPDLASDKMQDTAHTRAYYDSARF